MSLNYQTSTLSLTLPISCQICLGKVKQPVICANNHVFCSGCMETWLQKANQCPTCRVPITADNPCREILGGTNEGDYTESPAMKKCLRKTRGELLLREYEEEIDGLVREKEELKMKNQSLEEQLKTALLPCNLTAVQPDDKSVSPVVVEEWKNKLQAATDVCDKRQQDMDKLRETNKTLRSQNFDLVQENMRLKAEVASRSPQKFGRYTVAALEAKIQQYERDVDHLKRALERSDQYIEDLESRIKNSENRQSEALGSGEAVTDIFTQQQKINMMMRSLSDKERRSICSNPEADCRTFSRNESLVFMPSADHKEFNRNLTGEQKTEDSESTSSDFLPTTPSSAFRSLTLRSPGIREKKVAFKPIPHLRRLDFEEYVSPGKASGALEKKINSLEKFPKGLYQTEMESAKSVFWGSWQRSSFRDLSHPGPSRESIAKGTTSATIIREEPDTLQTSSEASMDAAYMDKISELDSMMHDGESSNSRGSQLSLAFSPRTDLDNTLVPVQQTCPDNSSDNGKPALHGEETNLCTDDDKDSSSDVRAPPMGSDKEGFDCQVSDRSNPAHISGSAECAGPVQTEEMSFDLLFDPLDEVKTAPSGSLSPETQHQDQDHVNPSFSSGCTSSKPVNTTRDRSALNGSQPIKRKSHSPFNTSSPTKLSKLM